MELHDKIAKEAYYLFEKNGRVHGSHEEHWYEAEKAVISEKAVINRMGKSTRKIKAAIGGRNLVVPKSQKKGIWPQDKPAAEGKKTTRGRRKKAHSVAKP